MGLSKGEGRTRYQPLSVPELFRLGENPRRVPTDRFHSPCHAGEVIVWLQ